MKLGTCRHCGAALLQGSFGCLDCGRLVDEHDAPETTGAVAQTQLGTRARDALLDARWRLIQPLGRGRKATTWLAHDVSFDRRVVVKLLDEDAAADPAEVSRFEQNARRLAALEHKNVIAVLALGRHHAVPFVAMQKAEGHSLAEHVHARGGRLPPAEAANLVAQLADAFEAAREASGPQGSVQPRAIFVSPTDGRVTLLDVRNGPEPVSDVTERTTRLEWVAPEVRAGATPDARSDVFTLASVARELICGAPHEARPLEVLLQGQPLLRIVLDKATDPDAAARFASPGELQQELLAAAALLAPRESVAPPPRPSRPPVVPLPVALRPHASEAAMAPSAPVEPEPELPTFLVPANPLEGPTKKTGAALRRRQAATALAVLLMLAVVVRWGVSEWEPSPPPPGAMEKVLDLVPPALELAVRPDDKVLDALRTSDAVLERKQSFERTQSDETLKSKARSRATAKVHPQVAEYLGMKSFGELQVLVTYGGREVTADVWIGDRRIGPSPIFQPLSPGQYIIAVKRRPLEPVKVPVAVAAGKSVRMEIELVPLE